MVLPARTKRTRNGEVAIPERKKPVRNATINRELAWLKQMFSLAVEAGKLMTKPKIKLLEEDNVRQGFFEQAQYESVLRHLPEDLRPIVTFAYITGWRVNSEVLTLEWRQVDFKAGEVRLEPGTTKNKEGRTFPLATTLRSTRGRRTDSSYCAVSKSSRPVISIVGSKNRALLFHRASANSLLS